MELHTEANGRYRFLMLDDLERVAEVPTRFLCSLERTKGKFSPSTVKRYGERLTRFLHFIESEYAVEPGAFSIDEHLPHLDLEDVDNFYSELHDLGRARTTIRNYEVPIKAFANWLSTEEAGRIHEQSLYDGIKWRTGKPIRKVPRFVLKQTVITLLQAMHIEHHRLASHLMYDAGLRSSEVARAKAIDLPNPDEYPDETDYLPLYVRGSKGAGGNIKPRYTIISRPMLTRLHRYHNTDEYKYCSKWATEDKPLLLNSEGEEWTAQALQKSIADAHRRSRLEEKVTGHRFRHGMAVSILSSDIGQNLLDNLIILQKLLGHNQLKTTEAYFTIPVTLLQQIRKANHELGRSRLDDAREIFEQTYLPRRKHAPHLHGPKRNKPE
jgi:integrase/recombinase XerD